MHSVHINTSINIFYLVDICYSYCTRFVLTKIGGEGNYESIYYGKIWRAWRHILKQCMKKIDNKPTVLYVAALLCMQPYAVMFCSQGIYDNVYTHCNPWLGSITHCNQNPIETLMENHPH